MAKLPTLIEMLQTGMHFGHRASKWHPKMKSYIFTERKGVHIIDLQQTTEQLKEAAKMIENMIADGKTVLFVGTKQQAKKFVKEQAERAELPFINERWIGGLLTNFRVVSRLTKKLKSLKKQESDGSLDKYTKKEQLAFKKEINRLQGLVGGIEDMNRTPDLLFVVDVRSEKTAITEARKKDIPVMAICDTNINPDLVDHIIAANDDSVQAIEMVLKVMADAAIAGKKAQAKKVDAKKADKVKKEAK